VVSASMRGSFSSLDALNPPVFSVKSVQSGLEISRWRFQILSVLRVLVSHSLARLYKDDRPSFQVRFIQPQVLSYPYPRESLFEDRNRNFKVELSTHYQDCKTTRFLRVTTHFVSKRLIKSSHNDGMS
jgi:hypothetical protein